MTQKDTDSELLEIFSFKHYLTVKINYFTKELSRVVSNIEKELDAEVEKALKANATEGRKLILKLKKDRAKLSLNLVARQLDLPVYYVKIKYRHYIASKNKGMPFDTYQAVLAERVRAVL